MFGWLKELLDLRVEYKAKKIDLDYKVLNIKSSENEIEFGKDETLNRCESCETLKQQLAIANQEKKDLLNRLLTPVTTSKPEVIIQNPRAVIPGRNISFDIKRRTLEAESRANARLLDEQKRQTAALLKVTGKAEDGKDTDVADLEAELDIVAAERESQTGAK